jgi:hypothetical protein
MFGVVGNSGVMRAKAGLIPAITVSIVGLALGALSIDAARSQDAPAADNCLSAPTGKAPQGSHWRYRTDPSSHNKCWHLQPDDAAQNAGAQSPAAQNPGVQNPGAQDSPATAAAATVTAGDTGSQDAPHARPAHTAHKRNSSKNGSQATGQAGTQGSTQPDAQGGNQAGTQGGPAAGAQAGMQAGGQPSRQATEGSSPWPDPPSPAGGGNTAWPDPSRLPAPTAQQATGAAQPATAAAQPMPATNNSDAQQPMPGTAAGSSQASGSDAASDTPTTAATATPASANGDIPVGLLLALAIAMLVAGLLLRRVVKMIFAQRHTGAARAPVLRTNRAGERTITLPVPNQHDPAPDWVDRLDQDVREALRNLLRTLERQAA